MSLEYENKPKYEDDHAICNCGKDKAVPTNGTIFVKTELGFSMEKNMFWCKRCGLALSFAQMDDYGDTWEQIQERNNRINAANEKKRAAALAADGLEDPY